MAHAREELTNTLKTIKADIKCAEIYIENTSLEMDDNFDYPKVYFRLKLNHTAQDLEAFMNSLNFVYDSGYGGQQLFGVVWLTDGGWLERGEYDGSEWWDYKYLPEITKELI